MPDQRQFRDTMGLFATGVAVIAVPAGDEVQAMTANAVSSVSLDPLLLLFCPAKKSHLSQHLAPAVPFVELPDRLPDILNPKNGVLCQLIAYP